MKKAGIIGAGAWGTALAAVCARAGLEPLVWAREQEVADAINTAHENKLFLPGVRLDEKIRATNDFADLKPCDFLFLVAPAQFTRSVLKDLKPHIRGNAPLVICSKGIEAKTGKLLSEVVEKVAPGHPVLVLSGPSFAAEVASGKPTAVTLAGRGEELVHEIGRAFGGPGFRPYWTGDVIGAQIGGALKNVLAIACGICIGKGLGESARAALITRGLSEIIRFAKAKGGRATTLMGLCGVGDLVLTCTSEQSRNTSLGVAVGKGKTVKEIMAERKSVAEGVHTAPVVVELAAGMKVEMPIAEAVNDILHQDADVDHAIAGLLNRPFSEETF